MKIKIITVMTMLAIGTAVFCINTYAINNKKITKIKG